MKKSIFYLLFALLTLSCSRNQVGLIAINGLEMCGQYSREEIFAALGGEPDRIYHDEEFPDFYDYIYGQDIFVQRGDEFYGGEITSARFYISKGIRVGDSIESINKLKGICTPGVFDKSKYAGAVDWRSKINQPVISNQIVNFYYNSQGIITKIEISFFYQ